MKLTEDNLRQIIREELNIQRGSTQPSKNSIDGYVNRFVADTAKHFASELKSAYDIEFEDAILGDRSFQTDFEVYNSRQDMLKRGSLIMFVKDGEVHINASGGVPGRRGKRDFSNETKFLDKRISSSEDPRQAIDIVSSFQILAGR